MNGIMAITTQEADAKFDVYAKPFVPQIFGAINEAPANVVPSEPARWVDFERYVQTFAGSEVLAASIAPYHASSSPQELTWDGSSDHESNHGLDTKELGLENYEAYFHTALEKEAIALQQECDDHAIYRVTVDREGGKDPRPAVHTLHVPGLREMSLRIEVGDIVQLRQLRFNTRGELLAPLSIKHANGKSATLPRHAEFQYDAVVWNIDRRNEALSLRIDHLARMSMLFNVSFTVQVRRINALHRAVSLTANGLLTQWDENWMRSTLFPEPTDGYYQKTLNKISVNLDLYDNLLNYEQLKAVNSVLNESYGPVPYIISGPPGTGKTKTIVELALQMIDKSESAHLLLCAPSDPAADTLVQRLSKDLRPSKLLRINSPARSFPEVPSNILPYCCVDDELFSLPSFKQIMACRIVVTTCRDAELLVQARLSNQDLFTLEQAVYSSIHPNQPLATATLHWTGLLIDEAAQTTEPEALIPISVVAPPAGHVKEEHWPVFVMAGDQHQLGPRTASKKSEIQMSLFERLLNRPFYRDHPLARSKHRGVMRPLRQEMLPILRPAFANLIRNYRSHPAILVIPSSLFYNDTLEPIATNTDALLPWRGWKHASMPVLFINNQSPDEIEQDGGGWYNINEAKTACQLAKSFLQSNLVQPPEICIMSPFQAQVRILRKFARKSGMSGVNIGPLEAFQGLESRLVILCTTRTRDRFLDQDLAKGLGVIHEPKRFNVALTRAKEGLFVVGNPDVLKRDPNWSAFLAFCARNGLVEGVDVDGMSAMDGEHNLISRLERQLLRRAEDDDATGGAHGSVNGVRRLGFVEDADQAMWKSGVDVEASLRARQSRSAEQWLQSR